MTLQQMTYLVALDDHRHFVRAANSCQVSQPTLTMQIQKLEEEVGATLIDRSVSPLVPTPLGKEVISSARIMLSELSALKVKINGEVEKLDGHFNLAVIPTIAPYLMPLWLPAFNDNPSNVHLNISELRTEEIMQGLKKGTLDIGILATPLEDDQLKEWPLYYEPFTLFIPGQHEFRKKKKIRPEDLNPSEMILLEEGHCFRSQALALCAGKKKSKYAHVSYKGGSLETIMNLVEMGMGYTLVPELAIKKGRGQDNVRRLDGVSPVREVSIVVHQRFPRKALIEYLQLFIQQSVPVSFVKPKKYRRIGWV